jgi:hypothetical protein
MNYLQPWKLVTLALGVALLIWGSFYNQFSDWDVGISIIMAVLTYLTAPLAIRYLMRPTIARVSLAILMAWFSIDGCYALYHTLMGNAMLREANAIASTPLYFLMGMFWLYDGSLKQLLENIRSLRHPVK